MYPHQEKKEDTKSDKIERIKEAGDTADLD